MGDPDIIVLSSDDESKPVQVTSPKLSLKRNRTQLTPDRENDERSAVESVSKKIKFEDKVLDEELSSKKPETTVTSPKLSLNRNRTQLTPDRKNDERSAVESVSKKIKFEERVLDEEFSSKKPETIVSTDTTPTVSVDMGPSTSFASSVLVIELSDDEKLPNLIEDEGQFQIISSMNSDATFKERNILRERRKKFMQLLDLSAPLMGKDASDEEKIIIANKLVNLFDTAQQRYVESENFDLLLDISFEKMQTNPDDVFAVLNGIKEELKKHKKSNKRTIKGSAEDNKMSITDDSISKDISIDSTSSLPSNDKVTQGALPALDINFSSRFDEYLKQSKRKEPDSASCSSLTSESSKTFASNRNVIDDRVSNLQTSANSNEALVSDNLVTNESSSSVIALDWYPVESNTSNSPSLKNHMSKKFKSAEDDSTSLSKTAISEHVSFPVSENDDDNREVDLSPKQNNRHNSIDESGSNLQTFTNSDKKKLYDNFITNEFCSSAIASAVGLCPVELKPLKIQSCKDPPKENLNSSGVAYEVSTSGMHLSSTTIFDHAVSGSDVNKEIDSSSLPSTSRGRSPSSPDSLSIDRRTHIERNEDVRTATRIKKLEKHLKDLDKAIKKCQQAELSLDDMDQEDSAYLKENSYKRKFVQTYNLLCKLKKVPRRTGRIVEKKFHYQGSRYRLINEAVENLINRKKVHEKFPDYHEVLNVIKQVHDGHDLGFNEVDISNEAKKVFEDIGEELKKRRLRDEKELRGCYLTDDLDLDADPAKHDDHMQKALEESGKKFHEDTNQIIEHYAQKQQQAPAEEKAHDDEEEDYENDEDEEIVANTHDDSEDLPGTAPASPENNDEAPVINIIERDDDDIQIINFSDKSTDPEEEIKVKQTLSVNKLNISQPIVLEDSESSGDLPSLQELVDKSKMGS